MIYETCNGAIRLVRNIEVWYNTHYVLLLWCIWRVVHVHVHSKASNHYHFSLLITISSLKAVSFALYKTWVFTLHRILVYSYAVCCSIVWQCVRLLMTVKTNQWCLPDQPVDLSDTYSVCLYTTPFPPCLPPSLPPSLLSSLLSPTLTPSFPLPPSPPPSSLPTSPSFRFPGVSHCPLTIPLPTNPPGNLHVHV